MRKSQQNMGYKQIVKEVLERTDKSFDKFSRSRPGSIFTNEICHNIHNQQYTSFNKRTITTPLNDDIALERLIDQGEQDME